MIRLAMDSDYPSIVDNEVLVRIGGLRRTYGTDVPFIQYYTDGQGTLLAIMDGVGLLTGDRIDEEWCAFLRMHPDMHTLHTTADIGKTLIDSGVWQGNRGPVMRYEGPLPDEPDPTVCTQPDLPAVYALLKDHFPGISPLACWYPDVSHRVRHGHAHISCILDRERVISTAMTVAETEGEALIGQVATHPDFRRKGMAKKCVTATILQCKGKTLYILPINENAQKLYASLGFVLCDEWAELKRT